MKRKNNNELLHMAIVFIALSFLISIFISIRTIHTVISKENEDIATLVAENIYNEIETELQRHIVAGKTIANNQDLVDLINHESDYTEDEMEQILVKNLGRYADSLDCNTAFVVSESSRRYYTQDGFNKVVMPGVDDHDIWYSSFVESGKEFEFNIDVDEVNNNIWTVFVNVRLVDDQDKLIGVCGIGTEMTDMQKLLTDMQEAYDVDAHIVNRYGLVQVDVDDNNIEKNISESMDFSDDDYDIRYEKTKDGYLIRKNMKDLGWTLVIERHVDFMQITINLVAKTLVVMLVLAFVLIIVSTMIIRRSSRKMTEHVLLDSYDTLAGVYAGLYLLDIHGGPIKEIKSIFGNDIHIFDLKRTFNEQINEVIERFVVDEYGPGMKEFGDLSTVAERMADNETIYYEFRGETLGWCRARFIAVRGEDKKTLINLIFALEIIDQEKKKQEELEKETEIAKAASEAKGKFLANMSHEIRTPINAVLGMDTMILRESTEPHIKEYAMNIQNASNTLLSLINDVLDFSKIESGKMEIVPVEYDFSSLIYDVVNMITIKAESKDLKVNLLVDRELPSGLFGDDVRIRQILLNIMNNAVKYTHEGSVTLEVTGEIDGNQAMLHFYVKDTGIGIKEEDMHKLFEDFERIEEARNRSIEGTGLGMSITTQLLSLMGSKLEVESVYGEGSNFHFDLKQEIRNHGVIGDLSKRMIERAEQFEYKQSFIAPDAKILVVDDNETNRLVFTSLIKDTEIQIVEAASGREALEKIREQTFDIIFLDHMMPEMDGVEVLKRMKKDTSHPNVDTPVIALTANAISGAKEQYLELGFDGYLSKPIIPDKLDKNLAMYLPSEKLKKVDKKEKKASFVQNSFDENVFPGVEGVDWNYAWLHMSNQELLLQAVNTFYHSAKPEADALSKEFAAVLSDGSNHEAWDLYRIKVHGMKSAANLLGFVPIAGMAASLEVAAREENIEFIKDVTPHFLHNWLDYKEKLQPLIYETDEGDKLEQELSHITAYLMQLVDAMNNFDVHSADAAMEHLKEYRYNEREQELLDVIAGAVAGLNIETVEETCKEMIQLLSAK